MVTYPNGIRPIIEYRIPNNRVEGTPPDCITTKYSEKFITHNLNKTVVIFTKDLISVGCTDITPEAAKYIWEKYCESFPVKSKEVILQS